MPETNEIKVTIGKYRWTILALIFFATTVNYLDRQVISLLKDDYLEPLFGWSESDYANIVVIFQLSYAIGMLGVGRVIDKIGTKLGYAVSLFVWSIAAIGHAFARNTYGFMVARGVLGISESGNFPAAIKTVAEWFPKKERALATGIFNSGTNVGAIIAPLTVPLIALWWGWQWAFILTGAAGLIWLFFWFAVYEIPSKHRRLKKEEYDYIHSDKDEAVNEERQKEALNESKSLSKKNFIKKNFSFEGRITRGTYWSIILSLIIASTLTSIPYLYLFMRMSISTINIGYDILLLVLLIIYVWMGLAAQVRRWHDLNYSGWMVLINLIPILGSIYSLIFLGFIKGTAGSNRYGDEQPTSILGYRQTWAFIVGKFLTDPVWWFYLFWLPSFLNKQYHMSKTELALPIAVVYTMTTVGSVYGGWLSGNLIKRGWEVYKARRFAMLVFALCVIPIVTAQALGQYSHWFAILIVGFAASAHQAWSANLFTTTSDMFPKKAVASVTGFGGMAGGIGGILIAKTAGIILDHFKALGSIETGYYIMFIICGSIYLFAWVIFNVLAPKMKRVEL